MSAQISQEQDEHDAYVLAPSCFCEICAICVSRITNDHLYIHMYLRRTSPVYTGKGYFLTLQ